MLFIYQKTLDLGTNFAVNTSDTIIGTYAYIEQIIDATFNINSSVENLYASTLASAFMDGTSLHTLAIQKWTANVNRHVYLTIRYTKSTDISST